MEEEDTGQNELEPTGYEGHGGALVEEAKRLIKQEEEDENAGGQGESGPKIKMSRIGGKNKKAAPGAAAVEEPTVKKTGVAGVEKVKASEKVGSGFSEQDIEFMKKAIQVLCQSTNPLGKSIDFVSDDIESMSKEYEHWRKEAQSCQQQLFDQ